MKGFVRLLMIICSVSFLVSCSTEQPLPDDSMTSEYNSFPEANVAPTETADNSTSGGSLEDELNQAEGTQAAENPPPAQSAQDEFSQFESTPVAENTTTTVPPPAAAPTDEFSQFESAPQAEAPPPIEETIPAPVTPPPQVVEAPAPVETTPAPVTNSNITLQSIQYRANDAGGTVVVEASGPIEYSTRNNANTKQFVIDIPNSNLPKKLQRPLNTRDFSGGIGSIDAYQSRGSSTSRIVIQLREGAPEPVVQAEGNSLLVVAQTMSAAPKVDDSNDPVTPVQSKLLSYESLEDFMTGNMTFYGKRISLEVDGMELRDIIRLIAEESGTNLIIADEVKGKMTLKLREIPWDQALVMIMKSKKLSYTRMGNVIRIALMKDIRDEEDEAIKLAVARKGTAPLKVKLISISYSKTEEIEKQVRPFLSQRGSVAADARTSAVVVSDIDEHMERIEKLIKSIDIPPLQVLIEGKVVEAIDQFETQIGVNWSAGGAASQVAGAKSSLGPITSIMNFSSTPGNVSGGTGALSFQIGTLDILGNLNAVLSLKETEGSVRVLSSPRVVTLHNEAAEITQSTQLPLITSTVSTAGQISKSVSFKDVTLKLNVTPQITNDSSVIMLVNMNRDVAGTVVDPDTQAFAINTRSSKSKVMVRNGQTAVIGGIYQSDTQESTNQFPYLGKIPVFGWLFKTESKKTQKNELLIFLTPRVLAQANNQAAPAPLGGEL